MSLLKSIIYGFVSGLIEFLPISSQGHQIILLNLFGEANRQPVLDLLIHLSVLLSLVYSCRPLIKRFLREQNVVANSRRSNIYDTRGYHELRLIKTAAVPLALGMLAYIGSSKFENNELVIAAFFLLNGIILMIPEYARKGNKDARLMKGYDGLLLGLFGALSVFSGISRVGAMRSVSTLRGAGQNHIQNWVLILSIPALIMLMLLDLVSMFALGVGVLSFGIFLGYLLAAAAAFIGGYLSMLIFRVVIQNNLFVGFGYYSIGTALFVFVLYLIT